MATLSNMYDNWCLEELRWDTQVNKKVWLAWFNKGLLIFEKTMLEYVSGKQNLANAVQDISEWVSEYSLPLNEELAPDFYSIIQLRVAYKADKNGIPIYRVCKQINLTDYNIRPDNWRQIWEPMVWDRISKRNPKFTFVDKNHIKIYPTPTEDVDNWLALSYNYMTRSISYNDAFWVWDDDNNVWIHEPIDISTLNLPLCHLWILCLV